MSDLKHREGQLNDRIALSAVTVEPLNEFSRAWKILRARWKLVACLTAVSVACALSYLAIAPRVYSAKVLVSIDQRNNAPLVRQANVDDPVLQANIVDSEVEFIRSDHVFLSVAELADFSIKPVLPSGFTDELLKRFLPFLVSPDSGGILLTKYIPFTTSWNSSSAPLSQEEELGLTADALKTHVRVHRLGLTNVVEINVAASTPPAAAKLANAFADVYISEHLRLKENIAKRNSQVLRERTAELQAYASSAEMAFEKMKSEGSLSNNDAAANRITVRELESVARSYRSLHDKFLERSLELAQQPFFAVSEAQVISAARPPTLKSAPQSRLVLAAAFLIGIFGGSVLSIIRGDPAVNASARANHQSKSGAAPAQSSVTSA